MSPLVSLDEASIGIAGADEGEEGDVDDGGRMASVTAWKRNKKTRLDNEKVLKERQTFICLLKCLFVSPFYLCIFAFEFQTGYEFVHTGKSISLYNTESKDHLGMRMRSIFCATQFICSH